MLIPFVFLAALCVWGFVVFNNARDRMRKDEVISLAETHRDCLVSESGGHTVKGSVGIDGIVSVRFVENPHETRKALESHLRQLGADRIIYTRKDSVEDFEISVEFSDGTRLDVRASDLHKTAPRKGAPQVGPSGRPMN